MAYDVSFGRRVVVAAVNSTAIPDRLRIPLLRRLGMTIGPRAILRAGAHLESMRLTLGADVFVNHGLFYDGNDTVTVEDGVALGPHVRLITATHDLGEPEERAGTARCAPIVIGRGAWLGVGATILPGVTVAQGCVIAAGAVVTRDTDPDGLYCGVPARRVRDLRPDGT